MKRIFCTILLIALSVFLAVSCNKKSSDNASQSSSGSDAVATKSGKSSSVTVRLLTDATGIDDKSFNASAWRGIERFFSDTSLRGKNYNYLTSLTQDQYIPNLNLVTDEGYSLIIASGFTWSDSIARVARDNPDQKYMLIDARGVNLPNVVETLFAEEMGSYLVGVIAAEQAKAEGIKNPSFGFVGGVPGATITRFEMGYVQGVKSVLPDAKVYDYYANNWGAPELGKAQAKNWFDSGVYCIFSAAGATGNGVIAQAKEYRDAGKNVWAIGVDSDQFADGVYNSNGDSAVLTSMLKKVENATFVVLDEISKDIPFKSGVREFGLVDNGVDYTKTNPKLSKEAIEGAERARKDIVSGKVVVEKTYAEAKAKGLVPDTLRAIDD